MGDQAGGFDHLTREITQLRQSTNELGDCRVELGRYQFLEDKEKRKKRIRHLNVECYSQQKQGNNRNRFSLIVPTADHEPSLQLLCWAPFCHKCGKSWNQSFFHSLYVKLKLISLPFPSLSILITLTN